MADIEDLFEATFDIEDALEEFVDPDDLLEDALKSPLQVALVAVAVVAGVALFGSLALALVVALIAFGPVNALVVLTGVSALVVGASLVGLLAVRTDVSGRVRDALARTDEWMSDPPVGEQGAGDTTTGDTTTGDTTTEANAIAALKRQYAAGDIDEAELERALEDVLADGDPEHPPDQHTDASRATTRRNEP